MIVLSYSENIPSFKSNIMFYPRRKNQKALEAALSEISYTAIPRCHTRAVCGAHLALRGEVLAMVELRRQVMGCTGDVE